MTDLERFYEYLDKHGLGVLICRNWDLGMPWAAYLLNAGNADTVIGAGGTPEKALSDLVQKLGDGPIVIERLQKVQLPRLEVAHG